MFPVSINVLERRGSNVRSLEDDTAATPAASAHGGETWARTTKALLRRIGHRRTGRDRVDLDGQGNAFLHLESGGTVVLGPQPPRRCTAGEATMARPISLGEVLAWAPSRKLGIVLPAASPSIAPAPSPGFPVNLADRSTVLSASAGERFVLVHGDNYGRVEWRRADGAWETVETVAEYMPAGTDRRYLRQVGEVYGQFQQRSDGAWRSESPTGLRGLRLYLIEGRFEMLTDAQHARRHGVSGVTKPGIGPDFCRAEQ